MWQKEKFREYYVTITHLAVTDTVDHLVIFTVEGVCQEAQALQGNKDESDLLAVEEERQLLPLTVIQ